MFLVAGFLICRPPIVPCEKAHRAETRRDSVLAAMGNTTTSRDHAKGGNPQPRAADAPRPAADEPARNSDDDNDAAPASPLSTSGTPTAERPAEKGHPYANACLRFPAEYYEYERFRIHWGSPDPYLLSRKIGRGKYSEVFTATNRILNLPCVVKMLKPVK